MRPHTIEHQDERSGGQSFEFYGVGHSKTGVNFRNQRFATPLTGASTITEYMNPNNVSADIVPIKQGNPYKNARARGAGMDGNVKGRGVGENIGDIGIQGGGSRNISPIPRPQVTSGPSSTVKATRQEESNPFYKYQ